jgi:hypothetical protein
VTPGQASNNSTNATSISISIGISVAARIKKREPARLGGAGQDSKNDRFEMHSFDFKLKRMISAKQQQQQ